MYMNIFICYEISNTSIYIGRHRSS